MKNREVAEKFANGDSYGKGSNLYFIGNHIYSYGSHFPIAIRLRTSHIFKYVWNTDKYSVSTSKHQNYVLNAIGKNNIILKVNTKRIIDLAGGEAETVKELVAIGVMK